MSKRDQLIRQLRAEAGADGFYSFEAAGRSGNWEAMHNMLTAKGIPADLASEVVRTTMQKPGFAIDQGQGMRGLTTDPTWGNPREIAAQITINVQRTLVSGTGILGSVPYVLFGLLDSSNGYRRAIQGLLKPGVTLTSVLVGETNGEPETLVFTYDDGTSVEEVRVTCSAAPYPMVLQSTDTNAIYCDRVRLNLPDKNFLASGQFQTDVQVAVRNMWGTNTTRSLNPGSFKSPEQFQEAILDLNVGVNFDRETMLIGEIMPPTPSPGAVPAIVSHIMFVRAFTAVRA